MMGPGFGYMPDYMAWMMFGSYLFWAALLAVGVFVLARVVRPDRGGSARAILDERLARGEIDAEEYRSRLGVLGT